MQCLPEFGVLPHVVAIVADGHDVTVVDEPIDQRGAITSSTKTSPPSSKSLLDVSTVEACL